MNKRTHGYKVKMARKMMTPMMIKNHLPIFGNSLWDDRAEAIRERVQRNILNIKKRKELRLKEKI